MANFLKVSPVSFHLDPGMNQILTVEGLVPSDANGGGKYALLNIKSKPTATTSNVAVAFAADVPIELNITTGEGPKETGEISSLSLSKPATATYQNVTAIFNNTGNYYYKIQSMAELKDGKGNVVETLLTA